MQIRYSLGEFLLLVLVTGLGIGLTAKFMSEEADYSLVMPVSLGVGLALFWGGLKGLHAAHWLGVVSPRRRLLLLLRGILYALAFAGVFLGTLPSLSILFGLAFGIRLFDLPAPVAAGVVVGTAFSIVCVLLTSRLFARARQAAREARAARGERDDPPAAAPGEPPAEETPPPDPEA